MNNLGHGRKLPRCVCRRRTEKANVLDASKSGQSDEKFQGVRVEDAAWSVLDAPKSGQSDEKIQWCVCRRRSVGACLMLQKSGQGDENFQGACGVDAAWKKACLSFEKR